MCRCHHSSQRIGSVFDHGERLSGGHPSIARSAPVCSGGAETTGECVLSRTDTDQDESSDPEADQPPPGDDHAFLGHPRGLATLSGLEVWERFSFLGMQAILVLYFADSVADGGLGMDPGTAASVSAAYGTMVYLVSVAGGWLADRILGSYRAVLWGGILIACGHYAMAVPTAAMTWAGLGLISAGTGLLKPNVATMVGKLYRTADDRRDAGFALYYMAINIGAFAGPLITSWLGEHQGWHWGFSAAAIGMTMRPGAVRDGPPPSGRTQAFRRVRPRTRRHARHRDEDHHGLCPVRRPRHPPGAPGLADDGPLRRPAHPRLGDRPGRLLHRHVPQLPGDPRRAHAAASVRGALPGLGRLQLHPLPGLLHDDAAGLHQRPDRDPRLPLPGSTGTPPHSAPSRWHWPRSSPRCGSGWATASRTPPTRSPSG